MKLSKKTLPLWRGLTVLFAALLAFFIVTSMIAEEQRLYIDDALGTKSSSIVTKEEDNVDLYTYKSEYKTTKAMVEANVAFSEEVEANGAVLLKNKDKALPLKTTENKVSLVGKAAYSNVFGGQMGSGSANNAGIGAEFAQATLKAALADEKITINSELEEAYSKQQWTFSNKKPATQGFRGVATLGGSFGMATKADFIKNGWGYDINEVTLSELESAKAGSTTNFGEYKTSVVVLGRINAEGRDYIPGKDGVKFSSDKGDTNKNENWTQGADGKWSGGNAWNRNAGANDPLGLSDDERAMIKMAKDNSDKVVVLINSNSMMEIPEVANDDGVDAILWIGTPGTYGMRSVAKILTGKVNPSGKLPDTYVYDNSASPAAQNWDIFTWKNADDINTSKADGSAAVTNGFELTASDLRSLAYTVYAEGIYVGYKYYETRYADSVLNPDSGAKSAKGAKEGATSWKYEDEVLYSFGYGLSYTDFAQTLKSVKVDKGAKTVTAEVEVKNNTELPGKEAVQLYVSVPYTTYDKQQLVEKSAIQLLDFGKVSLGNKETKTVTLTADLNNVASYDSTYSNSDGSKGTYILDEGKYYFSVGNGAHEAMNNILAAQGKTTADGMDKNGNKENVKIWEHSNGGKVDGDTLSMSKHNVKISNQLEDADLNYWKKDSATYLSRQNYTNTFPKRYEDLTVDAAMIAELRNKKYEVRKDDKVTDKFGVDYGDENITLAALKGADFKDEKWHQLLNQITIRDAVQITAQGGNATWVLKSINNPFAKQADGPNGYSSHSLGQWTANDVESNPHKVSEDDPYKGFKFNTTPNAPIVAATFDKDIAYKFGRMIGNESLWTGGPTIWAGGANQHRSPYEGRTHEYYSEDAVLSNIILTETCRGGRDFGCIIGPKHFAFNAIEYNRYGLAEFMTEQCAREGDLRCFQGAFESGWAIGGMTAFNRIGISYINGHEGLMQNILRKEWGFKGLLTTDMVNNDKLMVLADTIMGGITMMANGSGTDDEASSHTAAGKYWNYASADNIKNDAVLLSQLRENMHYQWWAYANSNAMNGYNESTQVVQLMTWWRGLILAGIISFAVLSSAGLAMYVLTTLKGKEVEA